MNAVNQRRPAQNLPERAPHLVWLGRLSEILQLHHFFNVHYETSLLLDVRGEVKISHFSSNFHPGPNALVRAASNRYLDQALESQASA